MKTSTGNVTIEPSYDCYGSFEPDIVKKRQTVLADNQSPKIIDLYGKGLSLRDIGVIEG